MVFNLIQFRLVLLGNNEINSIKQKYMYKKNIESLKMRN